MAPLDLLKENTELKAKITALEMEAAQKNEALQWYSTYWSHDEAGDQARQAIHAKAALGKPSKWLAEHDQDLLYRWTAGLRESISKTAEEYYAELEKQYEVR